MQISRRWGVRGILALACVLAAPLAQAHAASPGTLETIAGGLPSGLATSIPQSPTAVAMGPDGSLYVGDGGRVQVLTADGQEYPIAGNGAVGGAGDGGPATLASLGPVNDVIVNARGDVVLTEVDRFNNVNARIRVVAMSDCAAGSCPFAFAGAMTKGNIYTVAGQPGAVGTPGDDSPAATARLRVPEGLAVNARGDLLFADPVEGQVRMIAASSCAARSCPYGFTNAMTKGNIYPLAINLSQPTGLARTPRGDIAISSAGSNLVSLLLGSDCAAGTCPYAIPDPGAAGQILTVASGLTFPTGLTVNGRGDIVVANSAASDIVLIAAADCAAQSCPHGFAGAMTAGSKYVIAGVPGDAGTSPDGTTALAAKLYRPSDVGVDAAGMLLIGDPGVAAAGSNSLKMLVPAACGAGSCPYGHPVAMAKGAVSIIAGVGTYEGFLKDDVPAVGGRVDTPFGIAVNSRGDVLFSYFNANVVRLTAGADCAAGSCPFGYAGPMTKGNIYRVAGKILGAGFSPDGTPARDASLESPAGVAVSSRGDLVVALAKQDVVQLVAAADCAAGTCPFGYPGAMTEGAVYTIAGTGARSAPVDGTAATAADIYFPTGVAVNARGDLVIGLYSNSAVALVAGSACAAGGCPFGFPGAMVKGAIYTVAGKPDTPGFSIDGTPAAGSPIGGPVAVAVDPVGNLLFGDRVSGVVRMVAGQDCAAGSCRYGFPGAMTAGAIYTVAGTPGAAGASPNGTPARSALLGGITGVAVDARGDLLVSDDALSVVWSVAGADCVALQCPYGFPSAMTTGAVYALAGTPGVSGLSPEGTAATAARIGAAQGVAVGGGGDLFIADSGANRIYRLGPEVLPPPTTPPGDNPNPDPGAGPGTSSTPETTGTPGTTTTTPIDVTAPKITALSLTKRVFAPGKKVTAARAKAPMGTTVRLTLSEAATVAIAVQQRTTGRRRGARCVAPTSKLIKAKAKRCLLTTTRATLSRKLPAGASQVPFSGQLKRGALKPGSYLLSLTPTDGAGNRGTAATTTFKIVRR